MAQAETTAPVSPQATPDSSQQIPVDQFGRPLSQKELRAQVNPEARYQAKVFAEKQNAAASEKNIVYGAVYGAVHGMAENVRTERVRTKRFEKALVRNAGNYHSSEFYKVAAQNGLLHWKKYKKLEEIAARDSEHYSRMRQFAGGTEEAIRKVVESEGQGTLKSLYQELLVPRIEKDQVETDIKKLTDKSKITLRPKKRNELAQQIAAKQARLDVLIRQLADDSPEEARKIKEILETDPNNPAFAGLTVESIKDTFDVIAHEMAVNKVDIPIGPVDSPANRAKFDAALEQLLVRGKDAKQLEQLQRVTKLNALNNLSYIYSGGLIVAGVAFGVSSPVGWAAVGIGLGITGITALHKLRVDRAMRQIDAARGQVNIRAEKHVGPDQNLLTNLFNAGSNLMNVNWEKLGFDKDINISLKPGEFVKSVKGTWETLSDKDVRTALLTRITIGAAGRAASFLLGALGHAVENSDMGQATTHAAEAVQNTVGQGKDNILHSIFGNPNASHHDTIQALANTKTGNTVVVPNMPHANEADIVGVPKPDLGPLIKGIEEKAGEFGSYLDHNDVPLLSGIKHAFEQKPGGGEGPALHDFNPKDLPQIAKQLHIPEKDIHIDAHDHSILDVKAGDTTYQIIDFQPEKNGDLLITLANHQVLEVPHSGGETQVSILELSKHTGAPEHPNDAGDMNGYDHYQLPNGITEHAGDANDKILGTWQGAHTAYSADGKSVEFYGTYPGAKEFIQIDGHYYTFDPQKMSLDDMHDYVKLTPLDGGQPVQMTQDSFLHMVGYGDPRSIEAGSIVNQTYQQWADIHHITGTMNASDRLGQAQDPAWLARHPDFKDMLEANLRAKGLTTDNIQVPTVRMGEITGNGTIIAQNQYFDTQALPSTVTIRSGADGFDWTHVVPHGPDGDDIPNGPDIPVIGPAYNYFLQNPGLAIAALVGGGALNVVVANRTLNRDFGRAMYGERPLKGFISRNATWVLLGVPLTLANPGLAATVAIGYAAPYVVRGAVGAAQAVFFHGGNGGSSGGRPPRASASATATASTNPPGSGGPSSTASATALGNANQPPASGQPPVPPPSATPVAQPSVNAINSTIAAPTPRNRQGASNLYTNTAQTINTNRPTADSGKMDASHVQGLDEIAKAGGVQRGTDDTNYQHAQRINRVIQSNKRARNLDLTSHTNAETAARFAGVGEDDVQDVARHLQRNAIAQKHGRGNLADARQEMMQKVDGNATTPEIARDQVLAMAPVLQTTEVNKARAAIHRAFSNETDPSVRAVVGTLAENNSDAAKRVEAGLRFAGLTPKEERYGPLRKRRTVLPGTQAVVEAVNAIRQTKAINESGWAMQKLSDSAADQAIVAGVRAVYPNNPEYVRTVEAALAVPPPPNQPQRQELQLNLEQLTPGPEVPRAPDLTQDFKDKVPPQADMSTYSLKPEVRNELDAFMPTIRLENKVKNFITVTDNVAGEVDLDEPFMATEGNRIYPNPVIVGPMYYFVDATKSGPDRDQNKTFNESEKIAGGQNFFTGISGIMGGEIELGQAKSDLRAETQASAVLALGDAILQVYDKLGAEKLERHLQTQVGDPTSQTSLMYVAHDYVRQNPSVPKDADANSVISHFIQKIQGSQGQIKVGDTLSPETGVNPDSTLFVLKVSQETVGGNQVILPSVDFPATLAKIQALLPSIKTRLHNGELTNYDAMLLEFLGNGLDVTRLAQYIAAQNKGNGGQQNPQPPAGPGNPPLPDPNQPPGGGSAADALHSNVPDLSHPGGPNSPDILGGPGDPNRDTSQRPVLPANFENELVASASSKRRDKYSRVAEVINRGREQKIKPGQINELIRLGKQDHLQASLKDTTDFGRARVLEAAITGDTKYPLDLQDATNAAVVVRLVGNITDAAELGRVARNIQRIAVARKMPHRTSEDFVAIRNQLNTLFDTGQPTYQVVIEQARAMLVVDATRDSLKNAFATESTDTRVSLGFALTVSKDDGVKVSHAMEFADLTDGHGKMPQEIQPSLSREEGAQKVAKALDVLRSMYFAREPDRGNSIIAEAVSQAYTDRQFVKRVGELLQVTIPTPISSSQQPPNFSPGGQDTSVPSAQPASNPGAYTPRPYWGETDTDAGDTDSLQHSLPDPDRDKTDQEVIVAQNGLRQYFSNEIAKHPGAEEVTLDLRNQDLTALLQAGQDTQFDSWNTRDYVIKSYTEKSALRLEANNAGNDDELQQCAFIIVSGDQQYLRGRGGSYSGTRKDQSITDEAADDIAEMLERRILSAVPLGWDFVEFELPLGVGGTLKIKLEQHDSSASSSPDDPGNGGGTVLTEEQVHMAAQDTKSNEAVHPEQPTGGDYQSELTAITQGIQTGHPTVTADAVATVASFMNNHVDRVKELNSERGGRQTLLTEVREEAQKQHNTALERIEDLALDSILSTLGRGFRPPSPDDVPEYQQDIENMKNFLNLQKAEDARKAAEVEQERSKRVSDIRSAAISWGEKRGTPEADAALEKLIEDHYSAFAEDMRALANKSPDEAKRILEENFHLSIANSEDTNEFVIEEDKILDYFSEAVAMQVIEAENRSNNTNIDDLFNEIADEVWNKVDDMFPQQPKGVSGLAIGESPEDIMQEKTQEERIEDLKENAIKYGEAVMDRDTDKAKQALEALVADYGGFRKDVEEAMAEAQDGDTAVVEDIVAKYVGVLTEDIQELVHDLPRLYAWLVQLQIDSNVTRNLPDNIRRENLRSITINVVDAVRESNPEGHDPFLDSRQTRSVEGTNPAINTTVLPEASDQNAVEKQREQHKEEIFAQAKLLGDPQQGAAAEQELLDTLYPDFREGFLEAVNNTEEVGYNALLRDYGYEKPLTHEVFIALKNSGNLHPEDFFLTLIKIARQDAPAANEKELMATLQQKLHVVEQSLAGDESSIADVDTDQHPTTILPTAGTPASPVILASTMGNPVRDITERPTVPSMPTSYPQRTAASEQVTANMAAASSGGTDTPVVMERTLDVAEPTLHSKTPTQIEAINSDQEKDTAAKLKLEKEYGVSEDMVAAALQGEYGDEKKKFNAQQVYAWVKSYVGYDDERMDKYRDKIQAIPIVDRPAHFVAELDSWVRANEQQNTSWNHLDRQTDAMRERLQQEESLFTPEVESMVMKPYHEAFPKGPRSSEPFLYLYQGHYLNSEEQHYELEMFWDKINSSTDHFLTDNERPAYDALQIVLPHNRDLHQAFIYRANNLLNDLLESVATHHTQAVTQEQLGGQDKQPEKTILQRFVGRLDSMRYKNYNPKIGDGTAQEQGTQENDMQHREQFRLLPLQILAPSSALFRKFIEQYYEIHLTLASVEGLEQIRQGILSAEQASDEERVYSIEKQLEEIIQQEKADKTVELPSAAKTNDPQQTA